jgi:hypothetical protein
MTIAHARGWAVNAFIAHVAVEIARRTFVAVDVHR